MSDFIAIPPDPASPAGATVAAGDFWPAIDLNDFRDAMRIGNSVIPDPRLIMAIEGAILTAFDDLSDWQAAQVAAGYATLDEVDAATPVTVGDGKRAAKLWKRIVYAYACADLTETHRDMTATATGAERGDMIALTADDHKRNAVHATRLLLGQRRVTSELI